MSVKAKSIDKTLYSFPVWFEVTDEVVNEDIDTRITKVKIWLMHLGKNVNGSCFDKQVVEDAIPSLSYIPIVGFISEDKFTKEKDFEGHKYILVKDENGVKPKYIGSAYGVILSEEENNAHFEERLCDDGEIREFLVVDGIMWNMFEDSKEIIDRDLIKSQSMELVNSIDNIDGYEDEDGIFHFTKFKFRAACILGENVSPAMMNSTIEVQFTMKDFFKQMDNDLFSKITAFSNAKQTLKGGGHDMSKELKEQNNKTEFSQTVLEQLGDIRNIVSDYETVKDYWGDDRPRYCVCDIQDNEVIITDRADHYNYYGVAFSVDGDKPVINFDSKTRKKIQFVNYENEETPIEGVFNFGDEVKDFEAISSKKIAEVETAKDNVIATKDNELAEFSVTKQKLEEIEPKYNEFVKAEKIRLEAEIDEKKLEVFSRYEAILGDKEEFTSLRENRSDFNVDELEGKCAILYAQNTLFTAKSSTNKNIAVINLPNTETFDSNIVETKYGAISKSIN